MGIRRKLKKQKKLEKRSAGPKTMIEACIGSVGMPNTHILGKHLIVNQIA
jgi:hypothetical protein